MYAAKKSIASGCRPSSAIGALRSSLSIPASGSRDKWIGVRPVAVALSAVHLLVGSRSPSCVGRADERTDCHPNGLKLPPIGAGVSPEAPDFPARFTSQGDLDWPASPGR